MDEETKGLLKEIRDELIFMNKSIQKNTEMLVRTRQPCGQDGKREAQLNSVLTNLKDKMKNTPFAGMIDDLVKVAKPNDSEGG